MRQPKILSELPLALREELDRTLIERGFSRYRELVEWLSQRGYRISRATLQRPARRLREDLNQIKLATHQAQALAAAAPDHEGALNQALLRLVQHKFFKLLRELPELEKASPDLDRLVTIAHLVAVLSRAAINRKALRGQGQPPALAPGSIGPA